MTTSSPGRTKQWGLPGWPLTSTFPPSQARFASDRVRNRHETSSHTSSRTVSGPWSVTAASDEHLHVPLRTKLLDERLGFRLLLLLSEVLLDLWRGLPERHALRRALLEHLDHVEPERGFDDVADLIRCKREGGGLERRYHLTFREEAEIAATRGARVVRVGPRELREVGARTRLLQDVLGFRARGGLGGCVGALRHRNQHVT